MNQFEEDYKNPPSPYIKKLERSPSAISENSDISIISTTPATRVDTQMSHPDLIEIFRKADGSENLLALAPKKELGATSTEELIVEPLYSKSYFKKNCGLVAPNFLY
jgi:hypothetical protein